MVNHFLEQQQTVCVLLTQISATSSLKNWSSTSTLETLKNVLGLLRDFTNALSREQHRKKIHSPPTA